MSNLNTGAPHFKSIAKQYRHANYTLEKAINECVDNIIKKATEIHINTDVDDDNRLQELRISDNYKYGFESINELGIKNPFNMGHIKCGHDDDDETSEFGVGLKAGALSTANQLDVISRVDDVFHEVICDFIKMEKEEEVNASYNPKIRNISQDEYNDKHHLIFGSTIIMSKIRETISERMSQMDLTLRIKNGISNTYSRFLNPNLKVFVNGEIVEKELDLFSDPKCKPFTIKKILFVLEKGNDKIIIVKKTIERSTWHLYDKKNRKWEVLRNGEIVIEDKINEGYIHSYPKRSHMVDMSCIDIETTFAFYSDKFHTSDVNNEPEKPFDKVAIYKDNRKYCNKSLDNHNNGSYNFTAHKIEFSSKKIGKELGITFNKEITMDTKNDLTTAICLAIKDNKKEFSADIASAQNKKSCAKAIRESIIDLKICSIDKLSSDYRKIREELEKNNFDGNQEQVNIISDQVDEVIPIQEQVNIISDQVDEVIPIQEQVNIISEQDNLSIEQVDEVIPIQEQVNIISEQDNLSIEQVDEVIPIQEFMIIEPRKLLIEASKLLMLKASSEICDIQLEDSIRIIELIKSIIHL
jgi:hypothetical protein